jgi:hypothetical protein
MKKHLLSSIASIMVILLLGIPSSYGCKCQGEKTIQNLELTANVQTDGPERTPSEIYYEAVKDTANVDWLEYIPVFHYWRDIEDDEYLFDVPTPEQIAIWESLCEKENPADSVMRCYVQEYCLNMNQFMTIQDFISVWWQQEPYGSDDAFAVWRLQQYYSDTYYPDSEYDRFSYLKDAMESLCCYEPQSQFDLNFHSGMLATFQELFDRLMYREAVRHSSTKLGKALERENQAWEEYHAQLDSTFRIIDGDCHGFNGSSWSMAISGILFDNAGIRAESLGDFYYALTDSLDYEIRHKRSRIGVYEITRHSAVSDEKILQEYKNFMASLTDDEDSYPVPMRIKELTAEMNAWKKWMQSRKSVSSLLTGFVKDAYDNSTNNVRRQKYIMLKNRYQGYGPTSNDVLECLIPYGASDEEINGPSFDVRWMEKYHTSW